MPASSSASWRAGTDRRVGTRTVMSASVAGRPSSPTGQPSSRAARTAAATSAASAARASSARAAGGTSEPRTKTAGREAGCAGPDRSGRRRTPARPGRPSVDRRPRRPTRRSRAPSGSWRSATAPRRPPRPSSPRRPPGRPGGTGRSTASGRRRRTGAPVRPRASPTTGRRPGHLARHRADRFAGPVRRHGGDTDGQLGLDRVGVLELVDEKEAVSVVERGLHRRVVPDDVAGQDEQIVVVEPALAATAGRGAPSCRGQGHDQPGRGRTGPRRPRPGPGPPGLRPGRTGRPTSVPARRPVGRGCRP